MITLLCMWAAARADLEGGTISLLRCSCFHFVCCSWNIEQITDLLASVTWSAPRNLKHDRDRMCELERLLGWMYGCCDANSASADKDQTARSTGASQAIPYHPRDISRTLSETFSKPSEHVFIPSWPIYLYSYSKFEASCEQCGAAHHVMGAVQGANRSWWSSGPHDEVQQNTVEIQARNSKNLHIKLQHEIEKFSWSLHSFLPGFKVHICSCEDFAFAGFRWRWLAEKVSFQHETADVYTSTLCVITAMVTASNHANTASNCHFDKVRFQSVRQPRDPVKGLLEENVGEKWIII